MTPARPSRGVAGEGPGSVRDLAGSLRIEVPRLAYHLRSPATKSGITPASWPPSRRLPVMTRVPTGRPRSESTLSGRAAPVFYSLAMSPRIPNRFPLSDS